MLFSQRLCVFERTPGYVSKHWEERCHHQCSMFRALYITLMFCWGSWCLLSEITAGSATKVSDRPVSLISRRCNPKANHILPPPTFLFLFWPRIFFFLLFNEICLSGSVWCSWFLSRWSKWAEKNLKTVRSFFWNLIRHLISSDAKMCQCPHDLSHWNSTMLVSFG